jgi:hypothetical protein
MKNKIGHLPTEFIVITLLIVRSSYTQKVNKLTKELPSLRNKWGISQLLPSHMTN